jgi:hypothetical protein
VLDINGQPLREGAAAMLLCEIVAIEDGGVLVRVMNSELEILVGTKHDEVLGGLVADSELTAFEPRQYPVPSTQLLDHSDDGDDGKLPTITRWTKAELSPCSTAASTSTAAAAAECDCRRSRTPWAFVTENWQLGTGYCFHA